MAQYLRSIGGLALFADCNTEGSYRYYKNWYVEHVPSKRTRAQAIAVIIVLLGGTLPILALFLNERHYKHWVAATGALIVVSQGLAQSCQLDESWHGYTLAKMQLETAHHAWQQEIMDASFDPDPAKVLERAQQATQKFRADISKIVQAETEGYFSSAMKAPPR